MWKLIVNAEGETKYGPDVTWIDLRARHSLDKLATAGVYVPPELAAKVEELKITIPRDKVAFYNRALGSYESFGLNRNGDGFERHWLDKKHDTFVKNANYFLHHQNRDPALSRGRPVASAVNERTDMVDLIIVADMSKCAEQIQALENGKRVPTSMGCKVAADSCTICGHLAKTRDEYCEHVHKLASPPYGMRSVLPDGRVCGVMNPDPNFFDISDVLIGAAPESETLLKVASLGGGVVSGAELADLVGLPKDAAITKRVPGVIDGSPIMRRGLCAASASEPEIPGDVGDNLADAIGHTAALGIVLKPREFARAAKMACFQAPSLDEVLASEPMPRRWLNRPLDAGVMAKLAAYYDRRSAFMPALYNRLVTTKIANVVASRDEDVVSDNIVGRQMYAAYRRTLLDVLPDVGDGYWQTKCAMTSTIMYGAVSRDYVASAYLRPPADNKILDLMAKTAQPNHHHAVVTSTLADDLGPAALDTLAGQLVLAQRRSWR